MRGCLQEEEQAGIVIRHGSGLISKTTSISMESGARAQLRGTRKFLQVTRVEPERYFPENAVIG